MKKETLKRMAVRSALRDMEMVNRDMNKLIPPLYSIGDGRYQIISKIIENAVDQVLNIQESHKRLKRTSVEIIGDFLLDKTKMTTK
jgi:hypothetical protein